ncbi:MAG: hypothetical protein QW734_10440 [Candidatus Bathyarchaeia archaeon]
MIKEEVEKKSEFDEVFKEVEKMNPRAKRTLNRLSSIIRDMESHAENCLYPILVMDGVRFGETYSEAMSKISLNSRSRLFMIRSKLLDRITNILQEKCGFKWPEKPKEV